MDDKTPFNYNSTLRTSDGYAVELSGFLKGKEGDLQSIFKSYLAERSLLDNLQLLEKDEISDIKEFSGYSSLHLTSLNAVHVKKTVEVVPELENQKKGFCSRFRK